MADGTVDNLNIQISANASQAEKALDSLADTLLKLNKRFGSLNTSGLGSFSKNIGKVTGALKQISSVDFNETGINKTINALKRLMSASGKINVSDNLKKIADSIKTLSDIPDVSSGVNRFVASLARLSNSGSKSLVAASAIPKLTSALRSSVISFQQLSGVSDSVSKFVSSIAQLASAGSKTSETASGLGNLSKSVIEFFTSMKDAPKVSDNTIRMVQAMADLASSGSRVGTAVHGISSAMGSLSNVASKVQGTLSKAFSKIKSSIAGLGKSTKDVNTFRLSLSNLLQTAIGFQAGQGIVSFVKQAFNLGSAITEVENVVDVAFGSMSQVAYDFAENATEQFGLSELAAKQYAGTMMSIMNSSGVAKDAASEMSTTLAGLAGDLASFYNTSTDIAWQRIVSGIAGEIEPLRRWGINMSVANMQAYALSQGITKSWQSMTQAEQVMLRYNYLMSVTSAQSGDFARTSGTWANQIRLLTLNFQQLSATLGQGLIAAILPVIQALNALMAKLIQVAESFRNFVYALMGKKLSGSQQGIVDDSLSSSVADIGSAGETAAGGLDDATGAAQDLKKALSVLPFDQLNQLTDNTSSSGGGSGSGGSGGGVGGGIDFSDLANAFDELEKTEETPFNEWAERMRKAFLAEDWEKLGEEIAWGLNKGLKKIYDVLDWNKVGPPIIKFVDAFTTTLNSLIDSIDWDLLGRDFGRGLNIITRTANQFLEGMDFKNLGRKLSVGLRGAFDEIDWKSLGNMLGNGFMVAWDILGGFVEDMSRKDGAGITGWEELGTSIGEALNGVFERINFSDIAKTLTGGINGAFETLLSFTETFNWSEFTNNVKDGIATFLSDMNWKENGQALGKFISDLCAAIRDVMTIDTFYDIAHGIGTFLSQIPWGEILATAAEVIYEAIVGIWTGLGDTAAGKFIQAIIAFKIGTKLMPFVNNISKFFTGTTVTQKLSNAFQSLFSKSMKDGAAAAGSDSVTMNSTWSALGLSDGLMNLGLNIHAADTIGKIVDEFTGAAESSREFATAAQLANSALYEMAQSGGESEAQLRDLQSRIALKLQYDEYSNLDDVLSDIETGLEDAGVSSDKFKAALSSALNDPTMLDAAKQLGGSTKGLTEDYYNALTEYINGVSKEIETATSELGATLSEMGFTMTDGFIANLQAKAPEDQEAIMNTFQSIIDGTKIKASEISEIFKTMGITLPESVANSFTLMEPSVLAATVSLFDQVSQGQALKYDELVTAFYDLGIDITDTGLIKTLASQEPNVQQSALLLLAQLGNSVALSSDQLVYAFRSLGIGIANDGIIDTLANAEPSVQQQAIELLGQIQSAAQSERQPLIDEFNSLGVGTINEGLLSAFDSMDYDTKNQVLELLSQISGATTERRGEILAELENLGLDVGAGLIDSMDAKKRDISDEALELVNAFMDSLDGSEGFDSHSPSKKTETSGENAGQGLINGAISKKKLIKTAAETLSDTFLQPFDNLVNSMYSLGQNAISQYIAGFQSMYIPTPHMYVSSYRKYITGNSSFSIPNFSIDWYAVGGLFREATIAGIGEKGAEAVLPLTDRRAMGMIADSILNNASVGMDEEVLTNAVARGVAMAMMNNQGNNTPINVYATLYTEDNEVLARAVTKGQQSLDRRMNPTSKLATI